MHLYKTSVGPVMPAPLLIDRSELELVLAQTKSGESCGKDGAPYEFWAAVLQSEAAEHMIDFLNEILLGNQDLPSEWLSSQIESCHKGALNRKSRNYASLEHPHIPNVQPASNKGFPESVQRRRSVHVFRSLPISASCYVSLNERVREWSSSLIIKHRKQTEAMGSPGASLGAGSESGYGHELADSHFLWQRRQYSKVKRQFKVHRQSVQGVSAAKRAAKHAICNKLN